MESTQPFCSAPRGHRRRLSRGFTLIELMIAVVIVGLLTMLAYPAYTQSVRKSRRADSKTALLDLASREERFMAANNRFRAHRRSWVFQVRHSRWPSCPARRTTTTSA